LGERKDEVSGANAQLSNEWPKMGGDKEVPEERAVMSVKEWVTSESWKEERGQKVQGYE